MKKFIVSLVASASLLATASFAASQMGLVDVEKVFETSPKSVALRKELDMKFNADRSKIMAQTKTFRENMENYQKNQSIMSKDELASLKQKIMSEREALGKEQADFQERIMKARNDAMSTILESMHTASAKVAQEKGLDVVMSKSMVLYAKDAKDITADVMADMK